MPPITADAVFSSLVYTLFTWAHSLGLLWSETLHNILAMLGKEGGYPPLIFHPTRSYLKSPTWRDVPVGVRFFALWI